MAAMRSAEELVAEHIWPYVGLEGVSRTWRPVDVVRAIQRETAKAVADACAEAICSTIPGKTYCLCADFTGVKEACDRAVAGLLAEVA